MNFIKITRVPYPLYHYPLHREKNWEIVIYTSGRGAATVGKTKIQFKKGTIICTPPNIEYTDISKQGYANFTIYFKDFVKNIQPEPFVYQDSNYMPFLNITTILYNEFHLKQARWQITCEQLLDTLFLYLSNWGNKQKTNPYIEEMEHILIKNIYNVDFQVKTFPKLSQISIPCFYRIFKKETNKTPLQYLIDLRINESKNMLKIGSLSIKEIAYKLGFNDPYYFSRLFKKKAGISPVVYRQGLSQKQGQRAQSLAGGRRA